jgi:hypothetical protein
MTVGHPREKNWGGQVISFERYYFIIPLALLLDSCYILQRWGEIEKGAERPR